MRVLVLLTGLPGTGKSEIAAAVASAINACTISADPIDAALAEAGVANEEGKVGYELMKALTRNEVRSGRSVVVDAVNPFQFVRQAYLDLAEENLTAAFVIVTTCSDLSIYRHRVSQRHVHGEKDIDWSGVERQIGYYEPFEGTCLILDASNALDENRASAVTYVLGAI